MTTIGCAFLSASMNQEVMHNEERKEQYKKKFLKTGNQEFSLWKEVNPVPVLAAFNEKSL